MHPNQITQWRGQLLEEAAGVFESETRSEAAEPVIDVKTLHAKIGELTLVNDFLSGAGLKPLRGKAGPRVHDLRHSMVVNRMLEWYRTGINPQDHLPFLATYLGHRDINSTLVYITVTQELLHQANERFRAVGAQCLSLGREAQP